MQGMQADFFRQKRRFFAGSADPRVAVNLRMRIQRKDSMPQGDKSSYSNKQKRKAEHIEEGYEKRGTSKKEAARRAWATVNKESGGGTKSGSGRGKTENHSSSQKGGRIGGKKAARTTARS
jgi:plasmid stabilization system protein ParE